MKRSLFNRMDFSVQIRVFCCRGGRHVKRRREVAVRKLISQAQAQGREQPPYRSRQKTQDVGPPDSSVRAAKAVVAIPRYIWCMFHVAHSRTRTKRVVLRWERALLDCDDIGIGGNGSAGLGPKRGRCCCSVRRWGYEGHRELGDGAAASTSQSYERKAHPVICSDLSERCGDFFGGLIRR